MFVSRSERGYVLCTTSGFLLLKLFPPRCLYRNRESSVTRRRCFSTTLTSHTHMHTHNKLRNIWWNRWATWKEKRTTHNTHFRYHRRWLLETILYIAIPAVEYNNLIYSIYMYKNNNTWMKLHKHENSYENANTNTHPSVKWRKYLPGAEEVNVNMS